MLSGSCLFGQLDQPHGAWLGADHMQQQSRVIQIRMAHGRHAHPTRAAQNPHPRGPWAFLGPQAPDTAVES